MSTIAIKPTYKECAWIKEKDYHEIYHRSIDSPEAFWAEQARQYLSFIKPFSITKSGTFNRVKWFEDATLNVCFQCIDRHLPSKANHPAIIWEGDEPTENLTIDYQTLHDEVCRMSNLLKKYGIGKGDRVCIYLPTIPEAAYAMLACARIGAVHSVVFAGFSPAALNSRINDAECKMLITTDNSNRGGKPIPMHQNVLAALDNASTIENVLFISRPSNSSIESIIDWQAERLEMPTECQPTEMSAEDPLFILYTSGSTGKPKGILHTSAGYILYAMLTHKYIFDYHEGDIYWCSADVGWITGHSYMVYGPLANGATTLMFSGTPNYPTPARFWQVIDKHQVNIFYTAPTAIRSLIKASDDWVHQTKRSSLKLLGSVGEPINPEVWLWFHDVVGRKNCPVIDTWWQTETGGIMLSPLPGVNQLKPGFAQSAFFGIEPVLIDAKGNESPDGTLLAIKQPWPGMARSVFNDQKRYDETYFLNGYYLAGDEAYIDQDGDIQVIGRMDDVLNVSGHRLGTAEIENALLKHPAVAESAVVSIKHAIKGEAIFAFITLKEGFKPSDQLQQEIQKTVRHVIGPIATPEAIQWAAELPKTRSGKIMRRVLRKIANNGFDNFGDLSTLAAPAVVEDLITERKKANA